VTETGPSETSTEFGTTEAETITGPVKSPAVGLALSGPSVVVVEGAGIVTVREYFGFKLLANQGGNGSETPGNDVVSETVVVGETDVVEEVVADCGLPLCFGILTAVQILPYLVATQRNVLPLNLMRFPTCFFVQDCPLRI